MEYERKANGVEKVIKDIAERRKSDRYEGLLGKDLLKKVREYGTRKEEGLDINLTNPERLKEHMGLPVWATYIPEKKIYEVVDKRVVEGKTPEIFQVWVGEKPVERGWDSWKDDPQSHYECYAGAAGEFEEEYNAERGSHIMLTIKGKPMDIYEIRSEFTRGWDARSYGSWGFCYEDTGV